VIFRLQELRILHDRILRVLVLLIVLTVSVLGYMAVRIFAISAPLSFLEFGSLCSFAFACLVLCVTQLQCVRRMRRETGEKIEQMTCLDELTGTANFRHLGRRLAEEIQRGRRHGHPVAVLYIDLDGFKMVNDTYGHESGNQVLRSVSGMLRAGVRAEDVVGRIGGDEFAVVMPQTDSSGALVAAERLRKSLENATLTAAGGERISFVAFSMGVAWYPADGETGEELLKAADAAMYRAKRSGGDRVCQ